MDAWALGSQFPVGLRTWKQEHWPVCLLDMLPQGYGRGEPLRQLGFPETAEADSDWPLLLTGAGNPIGNLRVNLARQAAQAGVKRFVFISTIKVNGEGRDAAYRETDTPAPADPYAISKWEAEQGLHRIAADTGLEVVILRPPLVYGPGVKANFLRLMRTVVRGWPLPLGAIRNRRSLLYLGNFVDAIRLCIEHPAAAGQTFLLDDGEPVSTPGLIRALAHAMGRPARLLAVPVGVLERVGALLGKRAAVARLTGSLYVDSSLIGSRLGWTPPYTMRQSLDATVAALLRRSKDGC